MAKSTNSNFHVHRLHVLFDKSDKTDSYMDNDTKHFFVVLNKNLYNNKTNKCPYLVFAFCSQHDH